MLQKKKKKSYAGMKWFFRQRRNFTKLKKFPAPLAFLFGPQDPSPNVHLYDKETHLVSVPDKMSDELT